MNRDAFFIELYKRFPDLESQIGRGNSEGILHCEISDFRQVVEQAIDKEKLWFAEQYFRFVDECQSIADAELRNAIEVSFIEDFALSQATPKRKRAIRERAPKRIFEQIYNIHEQWR